MTKSTRSNELKIQNNREHNFMGWINPFFIPEHVKKPGFTYRYCLREVPGGNNYALETALQQGWKIVPKERWENHNLDTLNRTPYADKCIIQGDTLLLEIEDELYEMIFGYRENETREHLSMVRGLTSDHDQSFESIGVF